jgi:hypothetical protein
MRARFSRRGSVEDDEEAWKKKERMQNYIERARSDPRPDVSELRAALNPQRRNIIGSVRNLVEASTTNWRSEKNLTKQPAPEAALKPEGALRSGGLASDWLPTLCVDGASLESGPIECLGVYTPQSGHLVNGRPTWKHTDRDLWIAFSTRGAWMVQQSPVLGQHTGLVYTRAPGALRPDEATSVWSARIGGDNWVAQPTLSCRRLAERDVRCELEAAAVRGQKRVQDISRPVPPLLRLTGGLMPSGGPSACLGVYALVEAREVNGRPVWKHLRHGCWLAFGSNCRWMVQSEEQLGAHCGWIDSESDAITPDRAESTWYAHITSRGEWRALPKLRCLRVEDAEDGDDLREARESMAAARKSRLELEQRERAAMPKPPRRLRLGGVTLEGGPTESLGLYELVQGKVVNGRSVWRHREQDCWIAFGTNGYWMIQYESEVG